MKTENQIKACEIGESWIRSHLELLPDLLEQVIQVDKLGYAKLNGTGNTHGDNLYCLKLAEAMMTHINCILSFARQTTIIPFDEVRQIEIEFSKKLRENNCHVKTSTFYM